MRVARIGNPRRVVQAALAAIEAEGFDVLVASAIIESAPVGPSLRRYANSAALIACDFGPEDVLARLQRIERAFGRRRAQRRGQRWRARALDLDIVLWSGGVFVSDDLVIPHTEMRQRGFVLGPASMIAHGWRDPVSGLSLAHLNARLSRPAARARRMACVKSASPAQQNASTQGLISFI